MARAVGTTKTVGTRAVGRPRGRPPGPAVKVGPAARRAAVAAPPKVSKDDLRAQVEKLERMVATLRTRNREAGKTAKEATARIEELEAHVSKLERQAARSVSAAAAAPKRARAVAEEPARPGRGRRLSRERDPGDAVPPGVAVENPEPMDEEATAAFANLEEHLRPDGR